MPLLRLLEWEGVGGRQSRESGDLPERLSDCFPPRECLSAVARLTGALV